MEPAVEPGPGLKFRNRDRDFLGTGMRLRYNATLIPGRPRHQEWIVIIIVYYKSVTRCPKTVSAFCPKKTLILGSTRGLLGGGRTLNLRVAGGGGTNRQLEGRPETCPRHRQNCQPSTSTSAKKRQPST